MAYSVKIALSAQRDIDDTVTFIALDSQAAATKWNTELEAVIMSLQEMPSRFPVIREATELGLSLRNTHHYSHRVVFHLDNEKNIITVIRVYHGARQSLTLEDLNQQGKA